MLVRNRLKAGDFIVPIPLGMPLKLHYDADGILKDVSYWKDSEDSPEFQASIKDTSRLLKVLRKNTTFPNTVSLKGGTTFVYGALVFKGRCTANGYIPRDLIPDMLFNATCECDASDLTFLAFTVESLAAKFKGASPIRKWLSLSQFTVLPGFLAPFNDISKINSMIESQCSSIIDTNTIMAYATFNGSEELIMSTNLYQTIVTSPVFNEPNSHGAIMSHFHVIDKDVTVSYYDAVKFNIKENTQLVFENNKIICSYVDTKLFKYPEFKDIKCPVCGKLMPVRSVTRCSDEHCMSRMYDTVTHMLDTLRLPEMSFEKYKFLLSNHSILCVADVLDLEEYSSLNIEASVTTLLEAIILPSKLLDRKVISQFVSQCKNSIETIMYYANHTSKIKTDLSLGNVDTDSLIEWLNDVENISDLQSILSSDSIKIVDTDKYYSAAAIFRNTTICITGEFDIGSRLDVKGILSSYSADVVDSIVPNTRYVVVGDRMENIDGVILSDAKKAGIPVVNENTFFKQFDIYDDIKHNLL